MLLITFRPALRRLEPNLNHTYVWERSVVINIDDELFPHIFKVDWESTC